MVNFFIEQISLSWGYSVRSEIAYEFWECTLHPHSNNNFFV